VAIARALINHPKLILADEPTGNLDEENGPLSCTCCAILHSAGHTILVVTHSQAIGNLATGALNSNMGVLRESVFR